MYLYNDINKKNSSRIPSAACSGWHSFFVIFSNPGHVTMVCLKHFHCEMWFQLWSANIYKGQLVYTVPFPTNTHFLCIFWSHLLCKQAVVDITLSCVSVVDSGYTNQDRCGHKQNSTNRVFSMGYTGQTEVLSIERQNQNNQDKTGATLQLYIIITISCVGILLLFTFLMLVCIFRRYVNLFYPRGVARFGAKINIVLFSFMLLLIVRFMRLVLDWRIQFVNILLFL